MATFRLARPAQIDLASILATSAHRWGLDGRQRYAALLVAAMRQVADDPDGPLTRRRPDLPPGVRSFHIRLAGRRSGAALVQRPVHIIYYRVATKALVQIVRVPHERMDPTRHLDDASPSPLD